jgi:hypothetical protein
LGRLSKLDGVVVDVRQDSHIREPMLTFFWEAHLILGVGSGPAPRVSLNFRQNS